MLFLCCFYVVYRLFLCCFYVVYRLFLEGGPAWGFILRKPGGILSVSPAAYGSVDSWVKQNQSEIIIQELKAA